MSPPAYYLFDRNNQKNHSASDSLRLFCVPFLHSCVCDRAVNISATTLTWLDMRISPLCSKLLMFLSNLCRWRL